jgi:hypothetical protein
MRIRLYAGPVSSVWDKRPKRAEADISKPTRQQIDQQD